jgi:hypothetical protein
VRKCPDCGVPEQRTDKGVNLDPISGRCVQCLMQQAIARPKVMPKAYVPPFDPKARQMPSGDE